MNRHSRWEERVGTGKQRKKEKKMRQATREWGAQAHTHTHTDTNGVRHRNSVVAVVLRSVLGKDATGESGKETGREKKGARRDKKQKNTEENVKNKKPFRGRPCQAAQCRGGTGRKIASR